MADLSLRGVTKRFGGQAACAPGRLSALDWVGGHVLDGGRRRSASHG